MEELTGFEPAIMVLQTTSLTNLDTTPPEKWLRCLDSNQSMQESKSCALPAWLHPNIWWSQLELNQRYKNFQSFALPAEL